MTTWTNERCPARGPAGEACALPAGHAGDHSTSLAAAAAQHLGPPGAPSAVAVSKPKTSPARLAATPIALLLAGALFGILLGPLYLWFLGAAAIAIVYVLVASR